MKEPQQEIEDSARFRASVVVLLLIFFAYHFHQFIIAKASYAVSAFGRGGDFKDFYQAGIRILHGGPLYPDFIKPPLYGVLVSMLSDLSFETALTVYQLTMLAAVLGSGLLAIRHLTNSFWVQVSVLAILSGNWGLAFLVDRGNADGISASLALLACLATSSRAYLLGWFIFAVAVNVKTNVLVFAPALVFAPSLRTVAQRTIGLLCATFAIALLTPAWSLEWITVGMNRVTWMGATLENVSIFPIFTRMEGGKAIAGIVLITSLLGCLAGSFWQVRQLKHSHPLMIFLLLIPFSYAYPPLSYCYSLVLSPLLVFLYGTPLLKSGFGGRLMRVAAWLGVIGLTLQFIPVLYIRHFLADESSLFLLVPVGVMLSLISNAVLAWSPEVHRLNLPAIAIKNASKSDFLGKSLGAALLLASLYTSTSYFLLKKDRVLWFARTEKFRVLSSIQSWGQLKYNSAVMGGPLVVAGREYPSGLGTHSFSKIVLALDKGTTKFSGAIGADDAAHGRAAGLIGVIKIGDKEVFRSKVLLPGDLPIAFLIATGGAQTIELIVESAAEQNTWNQADWIALRAE